MVFRYWIEFDDNGDIKACHRSKYECPVPCEEFIVKLTPINRNTEDLEQRLKELDKESDEFLAATKKMTKESDKFRSEFQKTIRELRRIKI